jgi:hypothetical protein
VLDSCLTSEDCGADERCNLETEQCAFACVDATDCIEGEETCEPVGDGGKVCVFSDAATDECTRDEDCAAGEVCDATNTCVVEQLDCTSAAECSGDEICVDGVCVLNSTEYLYARIMDVTDPANTSMCQDVGDPGSDIFAIELRKQGQSYWAVWVNDGNIVSAGNDYDSPIGIIEGNEPYWSGACPDSFDGNVVSLGCGGSMLVEFVDDNFQSQLIEQGDDIVVYEWGERCQASTGGEQDQWYLSICESSSDTYNGECAGSTDLGAGTGIDQVYVTF